MKAELSAEFRLLSHCARTGLSGRHLSGITGLLEGPLDWSRVLELASWHRLSTLLFNTLRSPQFGASVPSWVLDELEGVYHETLARNLYFLAELRRILEVLGTEGAWTIVLKGAALAEAVYRDPALRPMGDLDILVNEEHLELADRLIRAFGYISDASPEIQDRTKKEHRHYPALVSPDGIVTVEVHHHIVRTDTSLAFDLSGFWERAYPATVAGTQTLVLAPEDLLAHLCLHFFLDRRFSSRGALGQLCDISEVMLHFKDRLDWDLFAREVQGHHLAGPVHCGLYAAKEHLGSAPPEEVLKDLEPADFSTAMAQEFIERRVLGVKPWLAHGLVNPQVSYVPGNVARSILRRLFPPRSALAVKYGNYVGPGGPFWLYFKRIFEMSRISGEALVHPWEVKRDLQIDRWMHSLYK